MALQISIGMLLAITVGIIWEVQAGQSFMIGVMLDVLPAFIFTIYAFRFSGARQLQQVAASFYRGETVKIMLTGALFILVIKTLPVVFPALLAGFVIMKVSQFMQSIFF
ncbi:ATP synthase subunit I [Psychrosphaera sp. B3R10]|uniref:ATP synthase subunit I n=1 Tax=unclassified Psychrosphaera TaxID=2641570 RepID=UPI001C0964FB|nr:MULTISPECIES: ATP synthase subunit I [unclassified Psychrosphaera]MBU2883313.1 ATP synthase subunit I [Psychrosphaera sp. I2R16]MBU2990593.1 ATP synthase subunit I [Psychrosphaera sp. B3R10]MDO6718933.1 ATP synthase subunit I [Psychrosphaera sp. 1_MG-2023]